MRQATARRDLATMGAVVLFGLAGCSSAGQERSFDRGEQLAELFARADREVTTQIPTQTGTARYSGVGSGVFTGVGQTFNANADLELTANFDDGTLSGRMSRWVSDDSQDFTMRGSVLISDGRIDPDGTFDAQLSGNVSREPTARKILALRDAEEDPTRYVQLYFGRGTAEGAFYDEVGTGAPAALVEGTFEAPGVRGFFIGGRD